MYRHALCISGWLLLTLLFAPPARAQFGGSRAGVEGHSEAVEGLAMLDREVVEGFIAMDGRAEIRVRPTEIRIVLAVTSEGKTAEQCQQAIDATIDRLKASWVAMEIPPEKIVLDFIAVLPMYEWAVEEQGSGDVGIEKKSGYRMQSNVHLAVPNDAVGYRALTRAFEQGVTDIIAFDYWSNELDQIKVQAREQAVKAARDKSDVLLGVLFDHPPPVINVQEKTTIRYPESLYHSFVNTYDENVTPSYRRDIPFIRAHRPRNTYYRGLYTDGDIQPSELPMHPEISVVSTVRLYFQSPAAKRADAKQP